MYCLNIDDDKVPDVEKLSCMKELHYKQSQNKIIKNLSERALKDLLRSYHEDMIQLHLSVNNKRIFKYYKTLEVVAFDYNNSSELICYKYEITNSLFYRLYKEFVLNNINFSIYDVKKEVFIREQKDDCIRF